MTATHGSRRDFLAELAADLVPIATPAFASNRDQATKREQAQALRGRFAVAAGRLESALAQPVEADSLMATITTEPTAAAALDDLAHSRRLVGHYLLDVADELDDERIDQLGDGYVRAASLWAALIKSVDINGVEGALDLERTCAQWMLGAAQPPTRYAF